MATYNSLEPPCGGLQRWDNQYHTKTPALAMAGNYLVAGGQNGGITIWNIEDGSKMDSGKINAEKPLNSALTAIAAYSDPKSGKRLIAAGYERGLIRIISLENNRGAGFQKQSRH